MNTRLLNDIVVLENTLAIKGIDNFDIVRRKVNSRVKTLGKKYLLDVKDETKLNEYYDKLKGKLNEPANTRDKVTEFPF